MNNQARILSLVALSLLPITGCSHPANQAGNAAGLTVNSLGDVRVVDRPRYSMPDGSRSVPRDQHVFTNVIPPHVIRFDTATKTIVVHLNPLDTPPTASVQGNAYHPSRVTAPVGWGIRIIGADSVGTGTTIIRYIGSGTGGSTDNLYSVNPGIPHGVGIMGPVANAALGPSFRAGRPGQYAIVASGNRRGTQVLDVISFTYDVGLPVISGH